MITILGATGNVGGKLVHELLARGHRVRAVARNRGKLEQLAKGAEISAGDISDTSFLSGALSGSEAAFVMIPPDYRAQSFIEHYRTISHSIAIALSETKIPHVVNLSSLGADLPSGTGPIKGLHEHEARLNEMHAKLAKTGTEIHLLHLRPTYFMENLLANVPLIQAQGIMGGAIRGDIAMSMIATADIATYAAKRLAARDFKGISEQELLGERDLTLNEAARIISAVLMREIPYVTFDPETTRRALLQAGFSEDSAGQFLEMSEAFNQGLLSGKNLRTPENTSPTRFEEFAEVFKAALAGAGAESAA